MKAPLDLFVLDSSPYPSCNQNGFKKPDPKFDICSASSSKAATLFVFAAAFVQIVYSLLP